VVRGLALTAIVDRLIADTARMSQLATPVIIARIGIMTMVMVDTVVVGRYSTAELARISMAFPPVSVLLVAGIGMVGGTSVMAARLRGSGDYEQIGAVWHRGLIYALGLGLLGLPMAAFAGPILRLLGQPLDLIDGAAPALAILALSVPFHLVYVTNAQFMEGLGRPLPGMILMVAANFVNLGLNLLFVGTIDGLWALGAIGTALATTLARAFLAIGLGVYIWRLDDHKTMNIRTRAPQVDPKAGHEQWHIGLANGASLGVEQTAFASMSILAGWVGADALAAYTIGLNSLAFIFMVALGFGVAAAVMVSEAYGAKNLKAVWRLSFLALGLNLGLMTLAGGAINLWPVELAGLFTNDPGLLLPVAGLIGLAGIAVIFDGSQTVAAQVLRARGETWVPTASHFISYIFVMVPLGYMLAVRWGRGAEGLLDAIILASILSSGLLVLRIVLLVVRDKSKAL
jgi:MATE family multidrug resistance protein